MIILRDIEKKERADRWSIQSDTTKSASMILEHGVCRRETPPPALRAGEVGWGREAAVFASAREAEDGPWLFVPSQTPQPFVPTQPPLRCRVGEGSGHLDVMLIDSWAAFSSLIGVGQDRER